MYIYVSKHTNRFMQVLNYHILSQSAFLVRLGQPQWTDKAR